GGYPHVLKEILEWMESHQDLKPGRPEAHMGPGKEFGDRDEEEGEREGALSRFGIAAEGATAGTNVRTSGTQTSSRSESDIRVNYWDPTKIIAGSNNIGGSGQQGMYYSSDSGVTWGQTYLPLAGTDSFHSDPTVDWSSDGTAWSTTMGINGSVLKVQSYRSTNGGATWIFDGTVSGTQTQTDKQMQWIDHSATSPYKDQNYVIWHNGAPAYMNRRTSSGWGTPIKVSGTETTGTSIGADVKTNSSGDVFGYWPDTGSRGIYVVKSTNGGASYGTPVRIVTTYDSYDIGVPSFNGRRILIYVSGAAYRNGTTNNVYALWADLSGDTGCTTATNEPGSSVTSACKTRIWFSRSTDGGATWSARVKINNQSGLNDQFNPFLAVDETNGNLGAIYYDTVSDAGRKKVDIYYQLSTDGGVSWEPAVKVTTAMTDETVSGADLGNQFGDYNGLSGYGNNFFPSWTDRRNNAKEEIWTAKITASATATYAISGSAGTVGATVTAGSASATSDSSNNYSIAGLNPGTYTVTPTKSGCTFTPASSPVTITASNVTGVNFTANCTAPTFTISGNAGTSAATVTAGSSSTTSDGAGAYSMSGFVAGTYTVTPTKSGCTFAPASASVTITSAGVTANFTATCGSGDTPLTSGVPVTGQSVALGAWKYYYSSVPAGATNLTFATTAATGDVDIYTQHNAKPTSSAWICRPYTGSGNETCSATNPASGTWWVGVNGYAAGNFTITGTVTTPAATYSISGNAGTASATVTAGSQGATADGSGNYTVTGLPNGTYTVTPTKSGCTFSPASASVTIAGANITGRNFTATCGSTTLFTNGFETSTGWAIVDTSGTAGNWTYNTSGTLPSASPHGGSYLAKFNSYDAASGSQTRIYRTTGFAIPGTATTATLKFWMYHDTGYSSSADRVQVQVSTGSTFANVGTAVNRYDGSTGWKEHTIDLTAYKGTTVQLGFLGISAYGNNVFVDDVTVTTP
ncbi:MAG TPA: pre-peptidase C-terminal domain-containing protein, partial [Thermoanaerobaculia bacterium]|nr:pre-peptidase C-terminal domain-containing protein [Thermoanaerobaculia bacterium]